MQAVCAPRVCGIDCGAAVCLQVRICTRMHIKLNSTDFNDKQYYTNIRKAITSGYFMQASAG